RPSETPFKSAPAQKVPSRPVSTATLRPSSASKRRNASARSAAVGPSTALRTAGRLIVTIATGPSVSYSRLLMRLPTPADRSEASVMAHCDAARRRGCGARHGVTDSRDCPGQRSGNTPAADDNAAGAHGRFDSRAYAHSVQLHATEHRGLVAAVAGFGCSSAC